MQGNKGSITGQALHSNPCATLETLPAQCVHVHLLEPLVTLAPRNDAHTQSTFPTCPNLVLGVLQGDKSLAQAAPLFSLARL